METARLRMNVSSSTTRTVSPPSRFAIRIHYGTGRVVPQGANSNQAAALGWCDWAAHLKRNHHPGNCTNRPDHIPGRFRATFRFEVSSYTLFGVTGGTRGIIGMPWSASKRTLY